MANRINYTDKVALNARTEIADINKHTAADDNEIKNVVNAHATDIETLEANQDGGVVRADTIVDEGDGRSFLPVSGDVTTAYIVDGEVSPVEIKNGNYRWDGSAYFKTAYQTVAGSKTDLATNGSQDVFTSQGAFNLDADLQGQIDSNDVEISQNISDIAQNTLDITQNESDIADNQTRSTDTENILLVGSDAYTHAERGVSDGFTTERLVQLDNEIEANLGANFYLKAGHSKGTGKIGIAVPDASNADLSLSRNSNATFVNKRGLIETALPNVPRFDWSSGEPVLLTESQSENLIEYSEDFSQSIYNTSNINMTSGFKSPSGSSNAYLINGANGTAFNGNVFRIAASGFFTDGVFSTRIKAVNATSVTLYFRDDSTGSVQQQSINIGNNWQSIENSFTMPNGGFIYIGNSDGDFYLWGNQYEVGDKATSYIPTDGATVVRLADKDIQTGGISQYIDSSNFTFEVDLSILENDTTRGSVTLSDGSLVNRLHIYKWDAYNAIKVLCVKDGGNLVNTDDILLNNPQDLNNIKVIFQENNFKVLVNGVDEYNNNSISTFQSGTITKLSLNRGDTDIDTFKGKIKSIKIS